jgi:F-type H+-transporting ATPase subunit b
MNAITQIVDQFGLRLPFFVAQVLNFIIVASLLWFFAFKPVMASITERQRKIDEGLKNAEDANARLEETKKVTQASIHEAQLKGQKLIEEAQKAAKEFADKQQQEAIEKASALITKAQAAIELEKKKMLAEARTEIARLVVATTERVLSQQLSEADRARYNEAAGRELTNV